MDASLEPTGDIERARILLVDDSPQTLTALRAILECSRYDLVCASTGEEALRKVLKQDFACILLDIVLPDINGVELASLLKQRERTEATPIIFLTGADDDVGFLYRAYSAGAVDYLRKPVDAAVLRSKVGVFVELWSKTRQIAWQAQRLAESERRAREAELAMVRRESEQRYRNLAEAIPHVVFTARPDGRIDYVNRGWGELTGTDPDLILTEQVPPGLHPEDAGAFQREWRAALERVEAFQATCRLRAQGGQWRWILCRALPERDDAGNVVAWLGTFTDIDEQRRAHEERARLLAREHEARLQAEEAVKARDEFLGVASHELKTPLTSLQLLIQGFTRRAEREGEGAMPAKQVLDKLRVAERQIGRLGGLVEQLLDVARIRSGKLPLLVEDADLAAIVQDVAQRFEAAGQATSTPILVDCNAPVPGRWDVLRVEQVVTNLISNAVKYGNGRPVHVVCAMVGPEATISVADEGIGIGASDLDRIFERFERAERARNFSGLGLGLYITRQLVMAHGGTIAAHSEEGQGATFTVRLPLVTAEPDDPTEPVDGDAEVPAPQPAPALAAG